MNVLKPNLRISVQTLLGAGKSQREIERVLGVDRKTNRRIQQQSKSPGVPTGNSAGRAAETAETSEQNPPPPPAGSEASGYPLGLRAAPRMDREPSGARAQRHEHLPGSLREVWIYPPLHLGQALRGAVEGPRTGTLRRARRASRRRGAGRLRSRGADPTAERPIPQTVSVPDDAPVLG